MLLTYSDLSPKQQEAVNQASDYMDDLVGWEIYYGRYEIDEEGGVYLIEPRAH